MTLSLIGIILGLIIAGVLIYKNVTPYIVGVVAAVIIAIFSGLDTITSLNSDYASGVGSLITTLFLQVILGSILGKFYTETGASSVIARRLTAIFGKGNGVIWGILVVGGLLNLAGISYGSVFILRPIVIALMRENKMSRRVILGLVYSSGATWAMTGPFSTFWVNVIPMGTLGTTSYAGLIPGLAAAIVMFVVGGLYLSWQNKRYIAKNPDYMNDYERDTDVPEISLKKVEGEISLFVALIPLVAEVFVFNVLKWNIIVSIAFAILLTIILMGKRFTPKQWIEQMNAGAIYGGPLVLNQAAIVGIGAVVKMTPVFFGLTEFLANSNVSPYVLAIIAGNLIACILASGTGAVTLSMSTLGDIFLGYGAKGYDMGNIHRLLVLSAGGLDSMPWSGAIVNYAQIFKTSMKESYFPVFMTCTVIPIIACFGFALPLALLGFK